MAQILDTTTNTVLLESARADGYRRASFIVSFYDTPNENRRLYPKAIWESVVRESTKRVGEILGQASHPRANEPRNPLLQFLVWEKFSLSDVANRVLAVAKVVETSAGQDFIKLAEAGIRFSVSTAGSGDIREEHRNGKTLSIVQPGFKLEAIDILLAGQESAKGARMLQLESALTEYREQSAPKAELDFAKAKFYIVG